jgi:hypothetical protein
VTGYTHAAALTAARAEREMEMAATHVMRIERGVFAFDHAPPHHIFFFSTNSLAPINHGNEDQ